MATPLKVLLLDIETAPAVSYVWRAQTEYINHEMLVSDVHLIGWGAKWAGARTIKMDYLTPQEMIEKDDQRVVESLAAMVREADISVAHNGDGFDFPVLNTRLLYHQSEPLGPIRTIDTLKLLRKNMALFSNKLDYVSKFLGLGGKIHTDMDLWRRCVAGEQEALDKMRRYNRKDVVLLEEMFELIKPYVRGLPRLVSADHEGERVCPFCGEDALIIRGYYRTNGADWPQFQCTNCRRYSKGRNSVKRQKLGVMPL